jgi:hypothetical protein
MVGAHLETFPDAEQSSWRHLADLSGQATARMAVARITKTALYRNLVIFIELGVTAGVGRYVPVSAHRRVPEELSGHLADVHSNQIMAWKALLQEGSAVVSGSVTATHPHDWRHHATRDDLRNDVESVDAKVGLNRMFIRRPPRPNPPRKVDRPKTGLLRRANVSIELIADHETSDGVAEESKCTRVNARPLRGLDNAVGKVPQARAPARCEEPDRAPPP